MAVPFLSFQSWAYAVSSEEHRFTQNLLNCTNQSMAIRVTDAIVLQLATHSHLWGLIQTKVLANSLQ